MCLILRVDIFELETPYSFTVPLTNLVVFVVAIFTPNSLKRCEIKILFFLQKSNV